MNIRIPATIANDLIDEINRLVHPGHRYLSSDSIEIRELLRKADKLQKVDAASAFLARAAIYGMCGDRENALAQVTKADALGFSRTAVAERCVVLVNLGYFSEAQKPYIIAADPTGGHFSEFGAIALNCGALTVYENFLRVAEKMRLDVDVGLTKQVRDAVEILSEFGITDADLAKHLDVVGEIMREQHMLFCGRFPDFFVWTKDEANQFVHFTYRLPVDAKTAERLDTELVTRYLDRFGSLPEPLSITIKSGLSANGRIAERSTSTSPTTR